MDAWLRKAGRWPLAVLALTGSLMLALGTPPDGMPALIWLGFFPLGLVARVVGRRPGRAFGLGWVGGLCTGLVGFPWIAETLERFGEFPPWLAAFGLFVFAAWLAVPFGVWMVAVAYGPRDGLKALAWPAVAWVAVTAFWPVLFPYTVVIGLGQVPAWIQPAELGGVALCEILVVLVGMLLADAALRPGRGRLVRFGVAVAIPAVTWWLGDLRMSALDREAERSRSVRVGIIQPNVPLHLRRQREKMRRLQMHSARAQDEGAQFVVWPEAGAWPYLASRPVTQDFTDRRRVLKYYKLPTIVGLATKDPGGSWEYNTVVLIDADGTVTGSFDKNILVPFGEYIPLVDPAWAVRQIPAMSHNNAGDGPARFEVHPVTNMQFPDPAPPVFAGPLICYEDIFPDFAREVAAQPGGIDLFVNVTIDTWFGDTGEPWEHLALAQFRSVEHRIPMVRSVAAGTSSYVDLTGRVAAALPVRDPTPEQPVAAERLVVDVPLARNTEDAPTIYSTFGWLLSWLCIAVTGGGLGLGLAGIRRERAQTGPGTGTGTGTLAP